MTAARTWTDDDLRRAVAEARSMSDVLRELGLRAAGGNHASLRRHVARLGLDTSHWDPRAALREVRRPGRRPLEEILVEHSSYSRKRLKERLYAEGLKDRRCELCGQGEEWRGRRMALILDHVNGVHDDNRLENLRIVCPNCNATLDTHCGRRSRFARAPRACARCEDEFVPRYADQRYCSRFCGTRHPKRGARPWLQRAERPSYDQLRDEIARLGYSAVGRRYGVSDNAVRKWLRQYEREGELGGVGHADGGQPLRSVA